MRKEIQKFIKLNKVKLNFKSSEKKCLLVDRARDETTFASSMAAYILNKNYNLDVHLFSELSLKNDLIKVYESFNIFKKFDSSIKKFDLSNLFIYFKTLLFLIFTYFKLFIFGFDWFIERFKINNVYFGDLIYDSYIRDDLSFLKSNFYNFKFFKILIVSLYRIFYIKKILNKNNYSLVICNTTGNVFTGLTMRLAIKKKIPVLFLMQNYFRFYKNQNEVFHHYFTIDKKNMENIKKDINWEKKFDFYLKKRFEGKLSQRDTSRSFKKKYNLKLKDIYKKLKINKNDYLRIGLFAPHNFSDANHMGGKFLFRDYYQQFLKTISFIQSEKRIFWIIREHPIGFLHGESGIVQNELKKIKSKNIIFCPKDINALDAINVSDIIVTGRGTIALEAAVLGKKPILAGNSHFSSLGFTFDSKSVENYKKLILNYKCNYNLSKSQIIKAKKTFYHWIFLNSKNQSEIFPSADFISINLKKKKLIEYYDYKNTFFKVVNKNLNKLDKKLTQKVLTKDKFFSSLEAFINKNKRVF